MPLDASFVRALRLLGRALRALEPYQDELVIAGGMVPLFYRHHSLFRSSHLPPIATTEADVSVPPHLPPGQRPPVADLLRSAGIVKVEVPGDRDQPGPQYFQDEVDGRDRLAPTYIEFLAPQRGPPREFVQPQRGLRAQALRYLDLLAFEPLELDASVIRELEVEGPCRVRLPDPAMFVLQKLLARRSGRDHAKRPGDLAHIYDVVLLSRQRWPELAASWNRAAAEDREWAAWIRQARAVLPTLFRDDADGPVEVARIYRDRMGASAPSETAIASVMQSFAAHVLAAD